ncbi:MAG: MFS transporter [Gammaproteobacteria bacterium]|nr:MFS transporter [Gammaproteobacteria bacterium]
MTSLQKIIITIVACAFFMEGLDASIINTALPQISLSLLTDPLHLKLALTAYLLTAGIVIPISGWMADRFGCRTIFSSALLLFLLGSILCGVSHSVPELVIARVIQGAGGALSLPVGRLLFMRHFNKEEFVSAMATTATFGLLGPSLGPLIGGALTTYLSWRAIFFVNIPIGLIGFYFVLRYVENVKDPELHSFDWLGFIILAGSLALLLLGLDTLIDPIVSKAVVIFCLCCGFVGLWGYWFYAKQKHAPLISIQLFDRLAFRLVVLGSIFTRLTISASPFLVPLLLQVGFHYTAMQAGLMTAWGAFGMLLTKFFVRRLLKSVGYRNLLIYNSILLAAVTFSLSLLSGHPPVVLMIILLFLNGVISSIQFTGMNSFGYINIAPRLQSAGSSFMSSLQQVASGFSIALAALVLECFLHSSNILETYSPPSFRYTFMVVALFPLVGVVFFRRLAKD